MGAFRLSTINYLSRRSNAKADQPSTVLESLLGGALAEELRDVEIHEIGVMKNDRFNRALDLIALVTVRGDDVQDFAGNAMLVSERDAAEWMTHLLSEFSLDHFA